jgi:restriction system protein
MPIPDYSAFMLPLLKCIADRAEHSIPDVTHRLVDLFKLSAAERAELLQSGQQTVAANRVAWAKTYLKKAGLLTNPSRGKIQITDEGVALLKKEPASVDKAFLERTYPSFKAFVRGEGNAVKPRQDVGAPLALVQDRTPEETVAVACQELRNALADDLLERVKGCSPAFFEQLVVRLLVAMGYGGTLADAGKAVGRAGDGGIDGVIKEDRLGLGIVAIQAKRWEASVGRPEVQAFAGAMDGARSRKGVLITTSTFSAAARDYVGKVDKMIVLIDGKQLSQYMIDYDIGVTTTETYAVKRADSDYFVEE